MVKLAKLSHAIGSLLGWLIEIYEGLSIVKFTLFRYFNYPPLSGRIWCCMYGASTIDTSRFMGMENAIYYEYSASLVPNTGIRPELPPESSLQTPPGPTYLLDTMVDTTGVVES
jgi:hypothetical protein